MNSPCLTRALLLGLLVLLLTSGCAPGNARYSEETGRPANFWAGLWHGLIIVVTFIVSLFTSEVGIYEPHNVGWAYSLGFIIGCSISLGGAARGSAHRKRRRETDWEKVGREVGESVRQGLASWRQEERASDSDWEELGRRIEERIREEMRKARS